MNRIFERSDLSRIIMVGEKVLIRPDTPKERTRSGLFLPPGVEEREKVHAGYVMKVGPGYPVPSLSADDEPWKNHNDAVKYIPIQPREGDIAVYLQNSGHELEFNKERYIIVPLSAILLLVRDEEHES